MLMVVVASRDIGVWITTSLAPFMVLLSLLNLTAATQDIATDGLAVSRLALRLVLLVLVMPPSAFPYDTSALFGSTIVRKCPPCLHELNRLPR